MQKARKSPFLFIILIAMTLSGCQQTTPEVPNASTPPESTEAITESPLETIVVTDLPTAYPDPSGTPDEPAEKIFTSYQLDVTLSYEVRFLSTRETIDYTNTTGGVLTEIPLIIPPASQNRVFTLDALFIPETQEYPQTVLDDATLWVTLPAPLDPGESIQFYLSYDLRIPEGRGLLGKTDRQLLLTDWIPFVPPYLPDTGWLINEPSPVGEYLVYPLANYEICLSIDAGTEPLVIAASLPVESMENGLWHYSAQNVRNVTFAFSPDYLEYTRVSEDVTIKAYVFPEHGGLGQRAADLAADAWALYENLYGDNPREYMAIIEADLDDGMEYDGAFLLSQDYFASADDTPQNYFELLIVHETAHQWFYARIANDQANEPWLDEAFATYSELLYLENTYPDFDSWWWNYRVYTYKPTGWVDNTIYGLSGYRPYVNAVYLRGVQFLHDLRMQIGEEAFFSVLKDYATPEEGDPLCSAQDFFDLIATYSQEDISNLLERYFQNIQS